MSLKVLPFAFTFFMYLDLIFVMVEGRNSF